MSDYFHESMIAKMVSSKDYQQGYGVGFSSGYQQGRVDAIKQMNILGLVNFKTLQNPITRKATIEIDYDDRFNAEQVVAIILEQLKEKK